MDLNGEIVTLRPFDVKYVDNLKEWYYSGDYEFFFRNWTVLMTDQHFMEFDKHFGGRSFFIVNKRLGFPPLGFVTLYDSRDKVKSVKLMVMVSKHNQNKGLMFESLKLIGRYVFDDLDYRKIIVEVTAIDTRTIKVVEAGGFELIARHPEECRINGEFHDELWYQITKDKYNSMYRR